MIAMKAYFFLQRLVANERGLTLPEYAIGLGLALVVGTAALATLGTDISGTMTDAGTIMPRCGDDGITC